MIAKKGFAGPLRSLFGGRKFKRSCSFIRAYIEEYASQALMDNELEHKSDMRPNFLHLMAKEEDNLDFLRDQLIHIMVAGVDAMTSTLQPMYRAKKEIWDISREMC